MTKEELAARLDGVVYGHEMPDPDIVKEAKESGLVWIYGASDDLMEINGAIDYEADVYEGGDVFLTRDGILRQPDCTPEWGECPYYKREKERAKKITAVWCGKGRSASWEYDTDIPHADFRVFEDGDLYCKGIVFNIDDLR